MVLRTITASKLIVMEERGEALATGRDRKGTRHFSRLLSERLMILGPKHHRSKVRHPASQCPNSDFSFSTEARDSCCAFHLRYLRQVDGDSCRERWQEPELSCPSEVCVIVAQRVTNGLVQQGLLLSFCMEDAISSESPTVFFTKQYQAYFILPAVPAPNCHTPNASRLKHIGNKRNRSPPTCNRS